MNYDVSAIIIQAIPMYPHIYSDSHDIMDRSIREEEDDMIEGCITMNAMRVRDTNEMVDVNLVNWNDVTYWWGYDLWYVLCTR